MEEQAEASQPTTYDAPSTDLRVRAARLAAGLVRFDDAAAVLGISLATYLAIEQGRAILDDAKKKQFSRTFGVSMGFWCGFHGVHHERVAQAIFEVLLMAADGAGITEAWSSRLRQMRRRAGFETAMDTAQQLGLVWRGVSVARSRALRANVGHADRLQLGTWCNPRVRGTYHLIRSYLGADATNDFAPSQANAAPIFFDVLPIIINAEGRPLSTHGPR